MPGSRVRLEQIAPSGEHVRGYEVINQPQPFGGSNVGPTPPIVPTAKDRAGRDWVAVDNGVTANVSGNPITVLDLSTVNAEVQGLAYSFPGGAADDNTWTFDWAVPDFIHPATPDMKLRLYFLMGPSP